MEATLPFDSSSVVPAKAPRFVVKRSGQTLPFDAEKIAQAIIKAGAAIVGHPAGPVRAPLADLKADEVEMLAALIRKVEA